VVTGHWVLVASAIQKGKAALANQLAWAAYHLASAADHSAWVAEQAEKA
jgi:hypothetical protein